MMKDSKTRQEYISFYNHTGIEKHLTDMARQGWLLEKISLRGWTYRRSEPQELHYCVSYYAQASEFDPEPSEGQRTFHDFCAHTGWKLVCTWHQMMIFRNEQADPVPIETDPVTEVASIHRACKKNYLLGQWIWLILSVLVCGIQLPRLWVDPIGILSSATMSFGTTCYLLMLVLSSTELAVYYLWYHKAKKAARQGIFSDTPDTGKFQRVMMSVVLISAAIWIFNLIPNGDGMLRGVTLVTFITTLCCILITQLATRRMKQAKVSKRINIGMAVAICLVFSVAMNTVLPAIVINSRNSAEKVYKHEGITYHLPQEEIPLEVKDLTEPATELYIKERSASQTLLLGRLTVRQYSALGLEDSAGMPGLEYTVTTVNVPFLYDWCQAQIFKIQDDGNNRIPEGHRRVYRETDAAPWGANAAYRLYHEEGRWLNTYLLCYEDRIIEIQFDFEPTPEQMAVVAEKLNP